tara:strand:+ start:458 stop:691 length:234 start_codon:yes stop_codon:yes gene_type:complete
MSDKNKQRIKNKIIIATTELNQSINNINTNGFNTESISQYNDKAVKLGDLQLKLKHLENPNKNKQYMEEIKFEGIIL